MTRPSSAWPALLLALAAAGLSFLPFLGQNREWHSHEERHAEIAREMAESEDWLIPRLLGVEYSDKPAIFHWLIALAYLLRGEPTMGAARLPSAVAAILGVLALFFIARSISGRREALLAAILLAGTPGYALMARTARPDMLYVSLVLLAELAATAAFRTDRPGRRAAMAFAFGLFSGLATVTKGPLGLALPLVFVAVLYCCLRTDGLRRALRTLESSLATVLLSILRAAVRRAPEVVAALLGIASGLGLWAVPIYLRHGTGYIERVLSQPDLATAVGQHTRAFYYYLGPFCALFAPFLPLLALSFVDAWKNFRERREPPPAAPLMVLATFVLFSAIPGKRNHYLLPVYPFAALAAADAAIRRIDRGLVRRAAFILAAGAILAQPLYYGLLVYYVREPNYGFEFALRVRDAVPPGARLAALGAVAEDVAFTARCRVDGFLAREDLLAAVRRGERTYVALSLGDLEEVRGVLGGRAREILRGPAGRRHVEFILLEVAADASLSGRALSPSPQPGPPTPR